MGPTRFPPIDPFQLLGEEIGLRLIEQSAGAT
jgi:hypothetical protein